MNYVRIQKPASYIGGIDKMDTNEKQTAVSEWVKRGEKVLDDARYRMSWRGSFRRRLCRTVRTWHTWWWDAAAERWPRRRTACRCCAASDDRADPLNSNSVTITGADRIHTPPFIAFTFLPSFTPPSSSPPILSLPSISAFPLLPPFLFPLIQQSGEAL